MNGEFHRAPQPTAAAVLEQRPGVGGDIEVGVENPVKSDAVESQDQGLGATGGVLIRDIRGLPLDGRCETANPSLVMPEQSAPQLWVGGCARDRDPDVDPGQGRLLDEKALIGVDQLAQGVGPLPFGVGVDGIDRLADDSQNGLLLRVEQVVEAPRKHACFVTDRLDRGPFEAFACDQRPGGIEDPIIGLEACLVPHDGNGSDQPYIERSYKLELSLKYWEQIVG